MFLETEDKTSGVVEIEVEIFVLVVLAATECPCHTGLQRQVEILFHAMAPRKQCDCKFLEDNKKKEHRVCCVP